MQEFNSIDDVLDFAIQKEQEAHDMYMGLAANLARPEMKAVFEQFAQEELGHKAKIEAVKLGGELKAIEEKVQNLKIADYLVDIEPSPSMTYQEALIIAMQAEKRAYLLYNDLAEKAEDGALVELFLTLAQEEAKHKLRFEIEYDENVMTEN